MPSRPRPNVLLIVADDLGYGDIGCYGARVSHTPHLDAMARNGIRFTDFHSNGPVCSPTRCALLTGRYQQRSRIEIALGEHDPGLAVGIPTIASCLASQGYANGLFGKWHLGLDMAYCPLKHGFQTFWGHRHGAIDYVSHITKYGGKDWWHDEQPVDEQGYCTALITAHAEQFIRANAARPFFACVAHTAIHFPWMAPGDPAHRRAGVRYDGLDRYGPHTPEEVGKVVKRMIEALDAGIGRLITVLRELQLERDTLVIFLSDNGGIVEAAGGYTQISSNGVLRSQKGSLYEGGHRVPVMAAWPGRLPAGRINDQSMITMDLLPTIASLIDVEPPPHCDGIDLSGQWLAAVDAPPRGMFWRSGRQLAARQGPWKLYKHEGDAELYRLDDDLSEKHNLATVEPQRVAKMLEQLAQWQVDVDRGHP